MPRFLRLSMEMPLDMQNYSKGKWRTGDLSYHIDRSASNVK